jgi:uncharacterized protein YhfF
MWPRINGLRAFGLGTPGEMRDRLNALVISGAKTATAGLWKVEYEPEGEEVDWVRERQVILDSKGEPVTIVEITHVECYRFIDVPWDFALAEGEGFKNIEDWRQGHVSYYAQQRVSVQNDDLMVCVWLRVVNPPEVLTF